MREPGRLYLLLAGADRFALAAFWLAATVRWTTELELTAFQLVLIGTLMEASVLVAEVPTGVIADVVSRKWSVVISQIGMGLALVVAGLGDTVGVLIASQIAWGVSWTFVSGADVAWLADELDDGGRVDRLILRAAGIRELGGIGGALAAIGVGSLVALDVVMVASGFLLVVIGLGLAVAMTERGFEPTRSAPFRSFVATLRAGASLTAGSSMLRMLVVASLTVGLGSEVLDRLDVRRMEDVGLPEGVDPVVLVGTMGLVGALASYLLLRWIESGAGSGSVDGWFPILATVAAGAIVVAAVVPVLVVVVVAFIVQRVCRRGLEPIETAWANRAAQSEVRATVLSFVGQATSLGEISGGVALGLLAEAAGLPSALLVSAALFLAAGVLGRTIVRRSVRDAPARAARPSPPPA